jgi:DHA2 family multidrug resistance protein-like MFS transporter
MEVTAMTPTWNRVPGRWLALGGISLGLLAVSLDITVLSLALPTLANAMAATESQLQWFVTAYTLALTAAMLPAGLVGDRFGRKRVMLGALAVFGVASAACALSPNAGAFIAARVALGVAGAAMVVMALSIITVLFDETERPRAIGVWGAANFLALPLGPIIGGWMLANLWWGWVFLVNVPVVLVGLAAVALLVPESRSANRPAIDWPGVAGSSAGLALFMYGVIEAGRVGWGDPGTIGPLAAGILAIAAFAGWEIRLAAGGRSPLVDLSLFRSRSFTGGVVLAALGIFGLAGLLFAMPQLWQGVQGLDAQGAGVRLLPVIGGMVVAAVLADRTAARLGARVNVAMGLLLLAGGLGAGSTLRVDSGDAFAAAWMFVAGLGAGLGLATAASAAMVELDAERSGVGSALVQAVIKLGPAFGAAVLGSVMNEAYRDAVPVTGLAADVASTVQSSVFAGLAVAQQAGSAAMAGAVRTAFVGALDDALRWAAVIALAGVPVAAALLPGRVAASAAHGAQSAHERTVVSG